MVFFLVDLMMAASLDSGCKVNVEAHGSRLPKLDRSETPSVCGTWQSVRFCGRRSGRTTIIRRAISHHPGFEPEWLAGTSVGDVMFQAM